MLIVLTVHIRGYLQNIPSLVSKIFSVGAYRVALYFAGGFLSDSSINRSSDKKTTQRKK